MDFEQDHAGLVEEPHEWGPRVVVRRPNRVANRRAPDESFFAFVLEVTDMPDIFLEHLTDIPIAREPFEQLFRSGLKFQVKVTCLILGEKDGWHSHRLCFAPVSMPRFPLTG